MRRCGWCRASGRRWHKDKSLCSTCHQDPRSPITFGEFVAALRKTIGLDAYDEIAAMR